MSQSLRVSRHRGRFWMARDTVTTSGYGPATVVLAALHQKTHLGHSYITSDSAAHQLPLGRA